MARNIVIQALAFVQVVSGSGDGSVKFVQSQQNTPYQRVTLHQVIAEPVPVDTVRVDSWQPQATKPQARKPNPPQFVAYVPQQASIDWLAPLSQPTKISRRLLQSVADPVPVVDAAAPQPGDDSVRFSQSDLIVRHDRTRLLQTVADPVPVVSAAAPAVSADSWYRDLGRPPDGGTVSLDTSFTFFAVEDVTVDKWYRPLSQPVRRKSHTPAGGVLVYDPPPPVPGDDSVRFSQSNINVIYQRTTISQSFANPVPVVVAGVETVTVDKWYQPFNQPVRRIAVAPQYSETRPIDFTDTVVVPPVVEEPFNPGGWIGQPHRFTKERYRKLIDELRQARLDALEAAKEEDARKAKAALKEAAAETQKIIELTDERNDETHRLALLLERAAAASQSAERTKSQTSTYRETIRIANQAAELARQIQEEFEDDEDAISHLLL